jgi:uncharacterized protein GlcG (DUF336 family)
MAVAVAAALCPVRSQAQVLTQRNVSTQLALAMANAAIAACKADGFDVSVVVVDRAGDVKLLMRADTANPHNADLARRKAYTAHTFNVPSMDVAKRTNGPTDLSGQRFITDIIPLGGGLPITVGMDNIGGIGLSGGPTQDADEKCAKAGLAAVASQLR